jgi:hypothetical protein
MGWDCTIGASLIAVAAVSIRSGNGQGAGSAVVLTRNTVGRMLGGLLGVKDVGLFAVVVVEERMNVWGLTRSID